MHRRVIRRLRAATEATPRFTHAGSYLGRAVHVHDGDTCRVAVQTPRGLRTLTVRMQDYDAPELAKGPAGDFGREVSNVLAHLLDDRIVLLEVSEKPDPYGRVLGRIYLVPAPELASCCPRTRRPHTPFSARVRGRMVEFPWTRDASAPAARLSKNRDALLCVNGWMLTALRLHPCSGARVPYTPDELRDGCWDNANRTSGSVSPSTRSMAPGREMA